MSATVNVNGRITGERDAVISVFDHGFLYGEGIYETMRTYHGAPFLYDRHMRRLRRLGEDDRARRCRSPTMSWPRRSGTRWRPRRSTARPTSACWSRAASAISPTILKATPDPSIVIIVKPQIDPPPDVYENGVRVVIVDVVRNHPELGQPDDQEQQPDEQRAGDAGGAAQRRVRRGHAELSRRADRVHDVEPVHRQERGGADAAARRGAAARHHARVPVRGRASRSAWTCASRRCATTIYSAPTKRSSPARRARLVPIVTVNDRTIGTGKPGPVTGKLLEGFRRAADAS